MYDIVVVQIAEYHVYANYNYCYDYDFDFAWLCIMCVPVRFVVKCFMSYESTTIWTFSIYCGKIVYLLVLYQPIIYV